MTELVSADGTRVAYEVVGEGPAVVLVDGAMCFRDSGPMRALAAELVGSATKTGCSAVLYDRRGRGRSGDTLPYAIDREIDDLAALVDAVGGRAALFGMSSGGALAALAAARLGDAVSTLVVFEPPYLPEQDRLEASAYTAELTRALAAGDRDAAVAAFLARVGVPLQGVEGMKRSPAWAGMTAIAPTLGYDDAVMGDSAVPSAAAAITAPTLALAGGASPDFLRWGARALAGAVPGARFEVLEGQGHDVDPVPLAAAIRGAIGARGGSI
ncbi:alpha/beta hydrolase [Agromyces protaetiae]|uniref:Alpha/beta hydrolase n=1 Tax=Agromyces protaetiae TaxID=2509455 RepID=A0A4P6FF92_9MICO|nr:alpha/beta hydrolase [Agromyces protaetiae]QAY73733.1 alpha/beta hydrolase [Agromyces protaetiae]